MSTKTTEELEAIYNAAAEALEATPEALAEQKAVDAWLGSHKDSNKVVALEAAWRAANLALSSTPEYKARWKTLIALLHSKNQ